MIRKRIISMLIALVFILGTVCAPVSFAETVEGDEVTNPEVTETEGESVIASGSCGAKLTWTLTEDGTLTIGDNIESEFTKAMYNYGYKYVSWRDEYVFVYAPWYKYRDEIKTLNITDEVRKIGRYAFYNCSGITGELVIPNSVEILGDSAFEGCSGLTGTLTLPQLDCATSVNASAFKDCSGITEVVIPECYEGINGDAFNGCSSLTDFEVAEHIDWINHRAFLKCDSLNNVYISNDDIRIEMAAARVFPKKTVLHGNADSSAYIYAKVYDNEFQCLEEHSFGDWVITKKPTATEAGEKMQTCSVCGHENAVEIPKTGGTVWGDVDGNGAVYANDAMLVLQYSAELIDGSNLNLTACDVDGDGEVYANDAMLILQYSSELIDKFPVMQ